MAATARLVVQMTPQEKKRLDARAKRAGISTAEFVRRRIDDDDISEYREEIEALLDTLEASAPTILQHIENVIEIASSFMSQPDRAHREK
jgi:hypothetical protein